MNFAKQKYAQNTIPMVQRKKCQATYSSIDVVVLYMDRDDRVWKIDIMLAFSKISSAADVPNAVWRETSRCDAGQQDEA